MGLTRRLARSESPKYQRPLRTLAGYAMQRTRRFEHVRIRRRGYVLPFFSTSNVALTFWVVPEMVDRTEEFVRDFLGPGDVFVDVGANVGTLSVLAAGVVGPAGRVLAVEPHPRTFDLLRRTVDANGATNVTCVDAACGAAPGRATITDHPRKDDNNNVDPSGEGFPVRTATLADLLAEHEVERVDLLKIDVEGYEAAVLRGLRGAFDKVAAVHVEVIARNLERYGDSIPAVVSLLQDHGFACFALPDDPTNLVALRTTAQVAAAGHGLTPLPGNPDVP